MSPEPLDPPPWPPPRAVLLATGNRSPFLPIVGLLAAIVAVTGPMLPAFAGQTVGDPDTAVYWVGLAAGVIGVSGSITAGVLVLSDPARSARMRAAAIVTIALGGVGALITFMLLFSG